MFEYLRGDISRVEGKVDKILDALTDHVKDDNRHFDQMAESDTAICTRLAAIEVAARTRSEIREKNYGHFFGWAGAILAAAGVFATVYVAYHPTVAAAVLGH